VRGQVSVDLVGRVAIPGGKHLAATFPDVPDVPIRRFVLRFHAGARGVVGLARGLCGARRGEAVRVRIASHGGFTRTMRPVMSVDGCAPMQSIGSR
jgi:hypothetical protein